MNALRRAIEEHWAPIPAFGRRTILFLLGATGVLAVAIFGVQGGSQNTVSLPKSVPFSSASAPSWSSSVGNSGATNSLQTKLVVQVVGCVKSPGVYELADGSRVLDAIFLAGGFTPDADQASLNLARPVNDGEQLNVLSKAVSIGGVVGGAPTEGAGHLISINLADAGTLDTLPGIGPALAQRIVDYRTANGGFRSLSDLDKVSGIGPSLLAKLKTLVTL
jgi:competence protein ComEA